MFRSFKFAVCILVFFPTQSIAMLSWAKASLNACSFSRPSKSFPSQEAFNEVVLTPKGMDEEVVCLGQASGSAVLDSACTGILVNPEDVENLDLQMETWTGDAPGLSGDDDLSDGAVLLGLDLTEIIIPEDLSSSQKAALIKKEIKTALSQALVVAGERAGEIVPLVKAQAGQVGRRVLSAGKAASDAAGAALGERDMGNGLGLPKAVGKTVWKVAVVATGLSLTVVGRTGRILFRTAVVVTPLVAQEIVRVLESEIKSPSPRAF